MPLYRFKLPLENQPLEVELANDQQAWSEAVRTLGELLRDVDGTMPPESNWGVWVEEGGRDVAIIELKARKVH